MADRGHKFLILGSASDQLMRQSSEGLAGRIERITQLLGIENEKALHSHPKVGTSWEGFIIESVLALVKPEEAYFWGTHQGAEIDLLLRKKERMWGIECKRTDTPGITPSIRIVLKELSIERIIVIYPGRTHFPITENVDAIPASFLSKGKNAVLFGA